MCGSPGEMHAHDYVMVHFIQPKRSEYKTQPEYINCLENHYSMSFPPENQHPITAVTFFSFSIVIYLFF